MGRTNFSVSRAGFIADQQSVDRRGGGATIDWANVPNYMRETPGTAPVTVVVGAAGAAAGAVAVPVGALSGAIPTGTVLDFGGAKFARLTAAAAAGATSLTVAALPTALVNNDTATYAGTAGSGRKTLKAGTVVGTLLGNGKISPRVLTTNPAVGLLATDATEGAKDEALSGYGVIIGGVIYENLLPEASGSPRVLPTAVKSELATNSKGFVFQQYADDRAS